MSRQRYQPGIQNGPVAKRRTGSKNTATLRASRSYAGAKKPISRPNPNRSTYRLSNRPGHQRDNEGGGSSVMWMLILVGGALSAIFIFALRSQINTHKIAQAEEQLKTKLDEYASRQKYLELDQRRALNTSESELAGRRNGLDQLKLTQEASTPSVVATQAPPQDKKSPNPVQAATRVVKFVRADTTKRRAPERVVKSSVIKARTGKTRVVKTPAVKIKKQSNDQRQALRSQRRR